MYFSAPKGMNMWVPCATFKINYVRMKYLFLIIGLFSVSCNAKDKSAEIEDPMNFIEVKNVLELLQQGEKSIGYDMSECNSLLSDSSSRGNFLLSLDKPYPNIESVITNFDQNLRGRLDIDMSGVQIPILKHKNKVFLRGNYSGESVSGSYAYILELTEPDKLVVDVVYQILDNMVQPHSPLTTEEDSLEIFMPEFDSDPGKFIQQNIDYPESAKKESIRGVVVVGFWVETDLTTSCHEIVQSIREDIDKEIREDFNTEALRVAKLISFKKPAFQYKKPIRYKMTIPIHFKP